LLYHAEVIHRNDKLVGYVRAASYGFTLGGAVGLAMIEADDPINKAYLREGEWEIDIAGQRYRQEVGLVSRAMYDPKMERVRF
jgi:4-methylaminobutanoate oxidase (formaldehyde-forming)